jgi:uncharacterized protein YdaU (DUF1376 family)
MSASRPFYSKWVWKDWFAKTRDMTPEARGVYMDLLAYCAMNSDDFCSMPDDERLMRRVTGCLAPNWARIRESVLAHFVHAVSPVDGTPRVINPRLREDATRWLQHCEYQRARRTGGAPTVPVRSPSGDIRALAREPEESSKAQTTHRAQPSAVSVPPTAKDSVIALPTNVKGSFFGVSASDLEGWKSLYPAVDVMQQLRSMAGWLDANPLRRKTSRGMKAFVNRWLAKEQDRGGPAQNGAPSSANLLPESAEDQMARWKKEGIL